MVTWSTYLSTIAVMLLVYYGFVILVFFRKELFGRFRPAPVKVSTPGLFMGPETVQQQPASASAGIPPVLDELEAFIQQSSATDALEADLLEGLRGILSKYPPITDPLIQQGISRMIVQMADQRFSVVLDDKQLGQLWK